MIPYYNINMSNKNTSLQSSSYRTHNCGELRITDIGLDVALCGWVQKMRNLNVCFIDIRDRFGITQIVVEQTKSDELYNKATSLGREYVILVKGIVRERIAKNKVNPTGDIEIDPTEIMILSTSKTPPFLIEDKTDGLNDIRMQYRFLDIRRNPIRENIMLRHKVSQLSRNFLSLHDFIEVETPILIKSTPGGARDFVVPSRMNPGQFYALPQSPQTFKQTLMVAGIDRYYQIAKCFRDEELRADRQPEFTQIDCEMSFVNQEDVINIFETFIKHILFEIKGVTIGNPIPRMTYADAMKYYGSDKPDIRFEMKLVELTDIVKGKGFSIFYNAELVVGFCCKNLGGASKGDITKFTELAKSKEIGANGLIWVKTKPTPISSVSKFYNEDDLRNWAKIFDADDNDLLIIFSGNEHTTRASIGKMRLAMGSYLHLRDPNNFEPLWVTDFPLFEWNEEDNKWSSTHHPFTSPNYDDIKLLNTDPGKVRAIAYDLVLNGWEIGGGSIRIHDKATQILMFEHLGFTEDMAMDQFGFLLKAFEYGAPPHGGIAFGLDRLCAILGGQESIRENIAFPKNNNGKDVLIGAPSPIEQKQLDELCIMLK